MACARSGGSCYGKGMTSPRCTVARLMRDIGLQGVIRGKPVKTTVSDKAAPCPLDRVNRYFHAPAPNMLWLSDFTYVATWQGFVYVAFVIDAFARRIRGWRPVHRGGLVHHSERLAEASIEPSVGSAGDSYDNALAETIRAFPVKPARFNLISLIAKDARHLEPRDKSTEVNRHVS